MGDESTNNNRIAFLFPGQGSQEIGMGADLFESSAFFRDLVAIGADMLSVDLKKICLRGPERELLKAGNLQALLCAVSLGYHRELVERGIEPRVILGHSLGEITSQAAVKIQAQQTMDLQAQAQLNVKGQMVNIN